MAEIHRIPLKKAGPTKKYSWKEKVSVHLDIAKAKYGRVLGDKTLRELIGREPVTDYSEDIGYYGPATLGGQKFQFLFDTGSSDLWVPKVGYNGGEKNTHNTFDQRKSKTFKTNNERFSIRYGKGSTDGIAATDTFSFAGFNIPDQAFGLADKISDDFANSPFDGIFGLGFDSLSELKAATPFQNLVNNEAVSSSVFGFLLGREKDGTSSEFILGGVDQKFASKIKHNKITTSRGFWQIALGGAKVDGNSLDVSGSEAIIDTGTTLVIIPPSDADAIHSAIPGSTKESGMYLVPSNTNAVVSFNFGGIDYKINSKDLAIDDAGNGLSLSGIQGDTIGLGPTWLVGDVFLKNVFSAYDINKKTVGFAPIE